jgi:ribosomal protein S18 acetylase RimI-like enzyme
MHSASSSNPLKSEALGKKPLSSSRNFVLRDAAVADAKIIARFEKIFFGDRSFDECRLDEEDVIEYFGDPDTRFIFACVDDVPVGYAVGWVHDGMVETLSLGVLAEHRRSGAASALLRAIEAWGKDRSVAVAQLESHIAKEHPGKFYPTQGYSVAKQVPGYYFDGGDALVWRKAIAL